MLTQPSDENTEKAEYKRKLQEDFLQKSYTKTDITLFFEILDIISQSYIEFKSEVIWKQVREDIKNAKKLLKNLRSKIVRKEQKPAELQEEYIKSKALQNSTKFAFKRLSQNPISKLNIPHYLDEQCDQKNYESAPNIENLFDLIVYILIDYGYLPQKAKLDFSFIQKKSLALNGAGLKNNVYHRILVEDLNEKLITIIFDNFSKRETQSKQRGKPVNSAAYYVFWRLYEIYDHTILNSSTRAPEKPNANTSRSYNSNEKVKSSSAPKQYDAPLLNHIEPPQNANRYKKLSITNAEFGIFCELSLGFMGIKTIKIDSIISELKRKKCDTSEKYDEYLFQ